MNIIENHPLIKQISFGLSAVTSFCFIYVFAFQAAAGQSTVNGVIDNTSAVPTLPDGAQLRPAKLVPGAQQKSESIADPKEVINAKVSIDQDFTQHKQSAINEAKRQSPSTNSGASGITSPPVLTVKSTSQSGPSKSGKSSSLEEVQLRRPELKSLITINDYLNPFQLDAFSSAALNLRRALDLGLNQNLDLAISRTNAKQRQNAYYSSLGNFLPDPTLGYTEYFPDGKIGLPSSLGSLFGASSALQTVASGTSFNNSVIRIRSPFEIMHAGAEFYAFRGGSILFGVQQSKHNYQAAKLLEKASLSDTLLTVTQNYYNLVLAETLLQIRIRAVATSNEQLRRSEDRFHSGLATNLDVLQSKTQLSRDRQALVDQQVNRRSAAIALGTALNMNLGDDYIPVELNVRKIRLIDSSLNIADILQLAIDYRPELKQYEELRLAAKKAIMVAAASLQPTVSLNGNVYGIGGPSNVQALGVFSLNVNWRLRGFGTVDMFNVQQAKWQARQTRLQAQKELQTVISQVRNSYLQILDKEQNITEATDEVESALEELRLAQLRKINGLGINLDVITAQRDYTQALIDKAQALINFDIAQAQLLHDMGLISVDALTSGKLLSTAKSK